MIAYLRTNVHIAPLANFRILFGGVMLASVMRFMGRGWVTELYVEPQLYFPYYGFEWVRPLNEAGMYLVFISMGLSALGIMLGAFYRFAAPLFFLSFTYVELLDKTNYLNHYYFVSIVAFLLIWVPAHRYRSLDVLLSLAQRQEYVPRWTIGIFRLQLGMVYFFAGVAKLNADWMLRAMPLRIWLPSHEHLPLIGGLLKLKWVAFVFSWAGALYDLLIPFALSWRKTRSLAYVAVVGFHLLTWILFPIGMFPIIMILATLIYFPERFHREAPRWLWRKLGGRTNEKPALAEPLPKPGSSQKSSAWSPLRKVRLAMLGIFLLVQALLPFRYLLYPGNLFWNEEGYRFSWRVMLMEKRGTAFFYVRDPETGREVAVDNREFLTRRQEKMMCTQPDMIVQYAHHLAEEFKGRGVRDAFVRAEVYVTLNGSGSRLFIDPQVNLAAVDNGYAHKEWILGFEK